LLAGWLACWLQSAGRRARRFFSFLKQISDRQVACLALLSIYQNLRKRSGETVAQSLFDLVISTQTCMTWLKDGQCFTLKTCWMHQCINAFTIYNQSHPDWTATVNNKKRGGFLQKQLHLSWPRMA
jgi:hypothetical protein